MALACLAQITVQARLPYQANGTMPSLILTEAQPWQHLGIIIIKYQEQAQIINIVKPSYMSEKLI